METLTLTQSVCFAYFGDGNFLGWYADSLGSIRPQSPKVYSSLEKMRDTITKNFRTKVAEKNPNLETLAQLNPVGAALINGGLTKDKTILSLYQTVELRAVACPYYDGPNPDFDNDAYEAAMAEYDKKFLASGIDNIPGPSRERTLAVEEFRKTNPFPKCNNWVFADYTKVKEWASVEPTEFIEVITAE